MDQSKIVYKDDDISITRKGKSLICTYKGSDCRLLASIAGYNRVSDWLYATHKDAYNAVKDELVNSSRLK